LEKTNFVLKAEKIRWIAEVFLFAQKTIARELFVLALQRGCLVYGMDGSALTSRRVKLPKSATDIDPKGPAANALMEGDL
jgi:hypothetical protein